MTEEYLQQSKKDFTNIAKTIAKTLTKGDILLLYGNLGSGKTYFTRKLCSALGVKLLVNSPSYVLLNEYEGKYKIYHYDLYRLSTAEEALELGIIDRLSEGITIIEWAEIITPLFSQLGVGSWELGVGSWELNSPLPTPHSPLLTPHSPLKELFFEHNGKYRNIKIVRR